MNDWYSVAVHALWIFGVALALAAFSYHNWLRLETGRSLREQLHDPAYRQWTSAGLALVAVSATLLRSSRWWERVLWAGLGIVFARRAFRIGPSRSPAAKAGNDAHGAQENERVEQQ